MQPVSQKAPNAWGLHDMPGNASEWVQDWYGCYPGGVATDPRGPGSGSERVYRGGGINSKARYCRVPNRGSTPPGYRGGTDGFRMLRIE